MEIGDNEDRTETYVLISVRNWYLPPDKYNN